MKNKALILVWGLLSMTLSSALAQEAPVLELRLTRDWGLGAGNNIEGTFSYRVTAPDEVARVVYLMDGEAIAESESPPYRYQFNTSDFPPGLHTMSAAGYTDDEKELLSNTITRNFLAPETARKTTVWIVGGIFAIVAVGWVATFLLSTRGKSSQQAAVSGAQGTAVCPTCGKPYARHLWAPNFGHTKYDRCPHCYKWHMVRRASQPEIDAALKILYGEEDGETAVVPPSPEEILRKQLDDSRFDK